MLTDIATHAQVLHVVALLVIPKYLESPQQPHFCEFSSRMCYLYVMEVCTVIESMGNFLWQRCYRRKGSCSVGICVMMWIYMWVSVFWCEYICGYMDVCYDVNMYVDMCVMMWIGKWAISLYVDVWTPTLYFIQRR